MTLLSSVAFAPSIAAACDPISKPPIGGLLSHVDAKLIELGKELELAWAQENAAHANNDRLRDVALEHAHRLEMYFRPESPVDRTIVQLLGERDWEDGDSFKPTDVARLRALTLQPSPIAARIASLVSSQDSYEAFEARPDVLKSDQESEAAEARTSAIVRLIEAEQAQTIEGLLVKVRAVRWCRAGELTETDLYGAATDTRISHSILMDLAAIGDRSALQLAV